MADVRELGGKVWHGPFSAPGVGRIAMLADPRGAGSSVITLEQAV
jgi:predicted enzyme related to lactoylglutathione lyase